MHATDKFGSLASEVGSPRQLRRRIDDQRLVLVVRRHIKRINITVQRFVAHIQFFTGLLYPAGRNVFAELTLVELHDDPAVFKDGLVGSIVFQVDF
ncbi:hypothetical protein D3C87_1714640 [compost metagenome]